MSDTCYRTRASHKSRNPPSRPRSSKGGVPTAADSMRIDMKVTLGTTTFHNVLVEARKTIGDNKLYFEGNVNVLAKPLEEVRDMNDDGVIVGYRDATGSIVHVNDVNTLVVNIKNNDNSSITLHPLVSVPSTSSYLGNQMVYANPATNSVTFTMKSMRPITTVRYQSSDDQETVLELDSTRLGVDLNDATVQHIVDYIQQQFKKFHSLFPRELHLKLNDQKVALEDSLDSLLREWVPNGGTVTVVTRPDLKGLLNTDNMVIFVKTLTGNTFPIFCFKSTTVGRLKELIQDRQWIPCKEQRLFFEGKQLEDESMLGVDYDLENESVVHLVLRLRGGMYHRTSGRRDFRNLDQSDVCGGHTVALICPDGSRTFMYIRPHDSLSDLKHMAMALVKEAHALKNKRTDSEEGAGINCRDPPLERSVSQLRSRLFNAKREHKRTKNELEMEKARMTSEMNSDGGQRETLVACVDKIVALRAQLVDQTAQIRLLQEQLIDKEMELEESVQSKPPPTINRE